MKSVRGVSLIELIVVVVLIAAATGLGAVAMRAGLPGQQLRSAARDLAAQLRFTRAQAIATGKPQVFVIEAGKRTWQAPGNRHGTVPDAITITATSARIEQPDRDSAGYRFFPEGASTGGRIVLSRDRAAWQLDIDWLTGEVTLARAEAPR